MLNIHTTNNFLPKNKNDNYHKKSFLFLNKNDILYRYNEIRRMHNEKRFFNFFYTSVNVSINY